MFADQIIDLILRKRNLIDVRAPIEFEAGSFPGSVNLPILSNEERAQVGTIYKQQGQEAAVALGHQLVSGKNREDKITAWKNFVLEHPDAMITCFRGGMRSQLAQRWLDEAGLKIPRIEGGYKKIRQTFIEALEGFSKNGKLLVISGATGSGKTLALRALSKVRSVLDLELAANHRGSAFGGFGDGQPTQVNFENQLATDVLRIPSEPQHAEILVEDESRLIGRCVQPDSFFELLRASDVVLIEETIEARVETTYQEYILNSDFSSPSEDKQKIIYDRYQGSLKNITKKLGNERTTEIGKDLESAWAESRANRGHEAHRIWIEKLLRYYYDPLYFHSLERRGPQIRFRGNRKEVEDYLHTRK